MIRKKTIEEKDSILAIIVLMLLLYLLFKSRWWVYTALAIAVISVLSAPGTYYLHRIWTLLTEILGRVSGGIILTLVFFLILMPTAFLKRWFGKKELMLKKGNVVSTFQNRNHIYTDDDLRNPW